MGLGILPALFIRQICLTETPRSFASSLAVIKRGMNFGDGVKSFKASVVSEKGGKIEIRVGGPDRKAWCWGYARFSLPGNRREYKDVGCAVRKITGAIDV